MPQHYSKPFNRQPERLPAHYFVISFIKYYIYIYIQTIIFQRSQSTKANAGKKFDAVNESSRSASEKK